MAYYKRNHIKFPQENKDIIGFIQSPYSSKITNVQIPIIKSNDVYHKIPFIFNSQVNQKDIKSMTPLQRLKKIQTLMNSSQYNNNKCTKKDRYSVNAITVDLFNHPMNEEDNSFQSFLKRSAKQCSENELYQDYFHKKEIRDPDRKVINTSENVGREKYSMSRKYIKYFQDEKLKIKLNNKNHQQQSKQRKLKVTSILQSIKQFELNRDVDTKTKYVNKKRMQSNYDKKTKPTQIQPLSTHDQDLIQLKPWQQ